MSRLAVLATLAFAGYIGISSTFAYGSEQSDNAIIRLNLSELGTGITAAPVSPKHARAEKLLAAMMLGECRGEGSRCMIAVGHVAMNRAKQNLDTRYGKGLLGVLKKRKAFSCFLKNDPNKKVIDRAMAGKLDPNTADGRAWALATRTAHMLMHQKVKDPTHGSTHYYADAIVRPVWIDDIGMTKVTRISGHVFYRKDA